MISNFFKLNRERQDQIINASLKEFSKKGYDDASTIEIAKEAGTSKSLLFHYIDNKRDLFAYICDYILDILKKDLLGSINFKQRDILERYRQIALIKIELLNKYPHLFDFLMMAIKSESGEITGLMEDKISAIRLLNLSNFFDDIDKSLFRDGMDGSKVKNLIVWALNGYDTLMQERIKNIDLSKIDYNSLIQEFDEYLDVLRKCFYK